MEPAGRKPADVGKVRAPEMEAAEHFELRDPFSEVTYNARTLGEMASKAEQLGAHRFVAVDATGQRSFVEQSNGEWQRRPVVVEGRDGYPELASQKAPEQVEPKEARTSSPTTKASVRSVAAAERAARVALLESALQERYIIKRAPLSVGDVTIGKTEYRFRGDSSRVAFTESTFRLATDTNSPSVARSMVDVAQARNWSALRVSGHEDFKRLVWLEASVRGVKAIGYEPNPADLEVLRRERDARQVNRIDVASTATTSAGSEKSSARGGGGRKAVLAAIDALLVAKGVSQAHREAVMTAAREKLAARMQMGQSAAVKVYDKSQPSQRTVPDRSREPSKSLERMQPAR